MQEEHGEQLSLEQANVSNETITSAASQDSSPNENGFGKFKSAQALWEAYQALEAEFTRKSQLLSTFEKDKSDQANLNETQKTEKLESFLDSNEYARVYADKLKEKAFSVSGDVNFNEMLSSILVEELASGKNKMQNPLIKNYVFQDEELKSHVIETYMQDLKSGKPPLVISGDEGEKITQVKKDMPSSLEDARKAMMDYFT